MINRITAKTPDKTNTIDYLKVGNIEIYNAREITKVFGKYFATAGETFAKKDPKAQQNSPHISEQYSANPSSLFLSPHNFN